MQALLHIGTEKTASSYLQSVAALGRADLAEGGVAFPRGWWHDEESMAAGRISAGNARHLAQAMDLEDHKVVLKSARGAVDDAARIGATSLLLSSEQFLPA